MTNVIALLTVVDQVLCNILKNIMSSHVCMVWETNHYLCLLEYNIRYTDLHFFVLANLPTLLT